MYIATQEQKQRKKMFEDEPAMEISETDSVREEMGRQTWSHAKVEQKKAQNHLDNKISRGKSKEQKTNRGI